MREAFKQYPKIARLAREVVVTEKIDGTNGCISLDDYGDFQVGSRNRWIKPGEDNFGFAAWAYAHETQLRELGEGIHFGEWWGSGIQRGYGLVKGEKRFSLFNVSRWCLADAEPSKGQERLPECCSLVPVLWRGMFDTLHIEKILDDLKESGSYAAPGFMQPEGVVVYHVAGNVAFKKTLNDDDMPKSHKRKVVVEVVDVHR